MGQLNQAAGWLASGPKTEVRIVFDGAKVRFVTTKKFTLVISRSFPGIFAEPTPEMCPRKRAIAVEQGKLDRRLHPHHPHPSTSESYRSSSEP